MRCRLILDDPAGGAWNMAVDEALLETALHANDAMPVLRWYAWSQPTLSLGYFQRWRDRPAALAPVPTVRRITGGGAILHDAEATYSLVLPPGTWPATDHRALVEQFHRAVARCLDGGLVSAKAPAESGAPFLCFHRRGENDVVCGEAKILGSAQRNRRGALLQHGSLLLCGTESKDRIVAAATDQAGQRWGWTLVPSWLSDEERRLAHQLAEHKYGATAWNERR